jgi:hypothetical protein
MLAAPLVLVPALAIVAITPSHGPEIRVREGVLRDSPDEIVVVEGQPPVIFTEYGYYRCSDNTCRSGDESQSFIGGWPFSAVGVGPDGAILSAAFERQGKDVLAVTRCAPDCVSKSIYVIRENAELGGLPRFDVAGAKDGTIWIALAQQRSKEPPKLELSLIRCGARDCHDSTRIVAGTIDGKLNGGGWDGDLSVHLRLGGDGRAVADFSLGWGVIHTVACDTAACARAILTKREDTDLMQIRMFGQTKALAIGERGFFAVTAEPAPGQDGFYVRIGEPKPTYERLVLWHCPDAACTDRRRFPLHTRERPPDTGFSGGLSFARPTRQSRPEVALAVLPDGTVLIAEGRNIVSLRV